MRIFARGFLILITLAGMCSCLGVNADIVLNQDNSGTLSLEYHINRAFDSLGGLDGNESRPPLPVGRMDFERTVDRIPGMKLVSYASRDAGIDRVVTVKLEFATIDALITFMDASGQSVQYNAGSNRMAFALNSGSASAASPELNTLLMQIAQGYNISVSMTVPTQGTANVLGSVAGVTIQSPGKKVSCSLPLETILADNRGITLEFRW